MNIIDWTESNGAWVSILPVGKLVMSKNGDGRWSIHLNGSGRTCLETREEAEKLAIRMAETTAARIAYEEAKANG